MENRILVIAHGHPDFSLGGAEIAAYDLFKAFKKEEDIDEALFLATYNENNNPLGQISLRRESEYLWGQSLSDAFYLRANYNYATLHGFRTLLREFRPTVINLHHYLNVGIEIFKIIKDESPSTKIILTLHEYLAICHQDGQMVKQKTQKLCFNESIEDCSRCMNGYSKEDFWMRKTFIQEHFKYVDHFVSPSMFLRDRYVVWGVDPDQISVIENGQASEGRLPGRELHAEEKRNRIAFFGRMTPYKGIDLLLNALGLIEKSERKKILIEIHGAELSDKGDDFSKKVNKLAKKFIKEGCLQWVGSYEPFQIKDRMKNIDWVVVPSIWWENSPMVIQEAFACGRPVITSDIGGMKEKITDGVDGLHFQARNPVDLASKLKIAAFMDETKWNDFAANITQPISYKECADRYKQIMTRL